MLKTIFSVSFFNIISAGLAFLINVFLARYFGVELYGRINLLLSFTLIINTLTDFGFANTNVIFFNKFKEEYSKEKLLYIANSKYKKLLLFSVLLVFILIVYFYYYFKLTNIEVLFLVFQGVIISLFRYLLSFHQADGNWKKFNWLNLSLNLVKALSLVAVFLVSFLLNYKDNFLTYSVLLYILSGVCLFCFVLALYNTKEYVFFKNNINQNNNKDAYLISELNKIVYPIVAINIVTIFAMRIDTLIIQKFLGEEYLGIYSAANSLALVFPLITGSIMQVLLKEVSGKGKEFLKQVLDKQKKYWKYLVLLILVLELISFFLIPLVFGASYNDSIVFFQILVLAHLGGIIFTPLESYYLSKKASVILLLKILQFSIITVVSFSLISSIGLFAVVFGILFSRFFSWSYLYFKSKKIIRLIK